MLIFPLFCRSEEKADAEVDDGDVLPSATKLKVKYGRGRNQKIYEAKVRQAGAEFSGSSCNIHGASTALIGIQKGCCFVLALKPVRYSGSETVSQLSAWIIFFFFATIPIKFFPVIPADDNP